MQIFDRKYKNYLEQEDISMDPVKIQHELGLAIMIMSWFFLLNFHSEGNVAFIAFSSAVSFICIVLQL